MSKSGTFEVSLRACRACGEKWVLTKQPRAAIVDYGGESEYQSRGRFHRQMRQVFTFHGVGAGNMSIELAKHEPLGGFSRQFSLTIKVT